nr:MAG TPA_asm: Protein of unknown function (DUF3545) [Caudoviricetes sp.]DAO36926.1 MAG TPA: Protein of unknown function (DUF3545) [Caudoviricetes sp.]
MKKKRKQSCKRKWSKIEIIMLLSLIIQTLDFIFNHFF